jgi:class 3 adenylate cyclase/PAS domain-containing protein
MNNEEDAKRLAVELRDTNFRLNQKIVQMETLYDAGVNLGASLQIEDVIGQILPLAVVMLNARGGFLFLKDERTRRFTLGERTNLDETQLALLQAAPMREKLKRAMQSDAPLYLGPGDLPAALKSQYMLVATVGTVGFIGAVDKETRQGVEAFDEEDGHLLELIGQQAGTALTNARMHRHMEEERNLNQSIVSSIGDGLISTNPQGTMMRVNPKVQQIFPEEATFEGKSCVRFFQRYGCKRIAEAVRASLQDGKERPVDDEQLGRGELTLNARITALRNEQDEVRGVVVALEDLTEQTRVRNMFKRYAGDQVVDHLLATDLQQALGGLEREVTTLFVDLVGSTELLDQIGAPEMVLLLNDCFTRLVDIILAHNGTLDKYTGDGFLALFGAPISLPDDTERAVHSALTIRDEMKRFNRGNPHPLGIKIGISRGRVVAGNIGSRLRMEYSVTGLSVNLGARLCDEARDGQILAGPSVHADLKDQFDFEFLERRHFKGIRQQVAVYQVIGPRGSASKSAVKEAGRQAKDKSARIGLTLPMIPDMELIATQAAAAVGAFAGLAQEKIEEVKVALIESCINAFEHSQTAVSG